MTVRTLAPFKLIAFFRNESSVKKGEIDVSRIGGKDLVIISCHAVESSKAKMSLWAWFVSSVALSHLPCAGNNVRCLVAVVLAVIGQ